MRLVSNEPARLYGTTKTYEFDYINNITCISIKFRPIIDQTVFYTYSTAQTIPD